MPNRYIDAGYWGGGMGYGFRGSSLAWPYVGRGRGGLPRCMSPAVYGGWSYWQPTFSSTQPAAASYSPQVTRQQEVEILKDEQRFIKNRQEQIDAMLQELEREK